MKFVYGKQDWRTKERGQENCYLLTNGLGGFSSCTMIGSCTRNDHALLMAAVKAPNCRYNMIHHLEETLMIGEEKVYLSAQDYVDASREEKGYLFLDTFTFEDCPKWIYRVRGVEVVKEIAMQHGENAVAVKYSLINRTEAPVRFSVTPHLQFVPKGQMLKKTQQFSFKNNAISSNGYTVYVSTNGETEVIPEQFVEDNPGRLSVF